MSYKDKVQRRNASILRDNLVHDEYAKIIEELGDISTVVTKAYIYQRISDKFGVSVRTVSFILNHTKKQKVLK